MAREKNQYYFVSSDMDVDYERIVGEAPTGIPFILVEEKDRKTNKVEVTVLFIHNGVLNHEKSQGTLVLDRPINRMWGLNSFDPMSEEAFILKDYRYVAVSGKIPGETKQVLESVRKSINPKNCKTVVTYL